MSNTSCPNCRTPIKEGVFSSVYPSSSENVKLINNFSEGNTEGYCSKCEGAFIKVAAPNYLKQKQRYLAILEKLLPELPILSIHNPEKWDFMPVSIITGQTTLGTGLISEFTSSFTDFFGTQSGAYNKKLSQGENYCMNMLRKKALDLGCNAILGTDIDYSEAGGSKGMLMVCMAGTAVKIRNPEVCFQDPEKIETLINANAWLTKYQDIVI